MSLRIKLRVGRWRVRVALGNVLAWCYYGIAHESETAAPSRGCGLCRLRAERRVRVRACLHEGPGTPGRNGAYVPLLLELSFRAWRRCCDIGAVWSRGPTYGSSASCLLRTLGRADGGCRRSCARCGAGDRTTVRHERWWRGV